MSALQLIANIVIGGSVLAAAIWFVYRLAKQTDAPQPRGEGFPDDQSRHPDVVRLQETVRRQRVVLGCLGVAVVLLILGAIVGYQFLEFLRNLGIGHPG